MQNEKKVLLLLISSSPERLVEKIKNDFAGRAASEPLCPADILVVSTQPSSAVPFSVSAHALGQDRTVVILHNSSLRRYGERVKAGYQYAILKGYDYIIDFRDYHEDILRSIFPLTQSLSSGQADVVCCIPGENRLVALARRSAQFFAAAFSPACVIDWIMCAGRAFSVPALSSIPFNFNADTAVFDADILVQLMDKKQRMAVLPVPLPGKMPSLPRICLLYGRFVLSSVLAHMQKWEIMYHPRFDYCEATTVYTPKFGYRSSHQYAFDHIRPGSAVLDLGCGPGFMARKLAEKQVKTISLDRAILPEARTHSFKTIEMDMEEYDFSSGKDEVDTLLLLDAIEHLRSPESLLKKIRQRYPGNEIIITTANVGFFVTRLSLLLGQFNYGKRGILDLDHKRLFTFTSLARLLHLQGYEIVEMQGLPAPFPVAFGNGYFSRVLLLINRMLIRCGRGMFSYQVAVIARPKATLEALLRQAGDRPEARS